MKKLLAMFLAFVMMIAVLPVTAAATTGIFPDVDMLEILPGETATFDRFVIQKSGGRFTGTEVITVTLEGNYELVQSPIYDDNGNVRSGITWGNNSLTVVAPANVREFNLKNLTIKAPADAVVGDTVWATASMGTVSGKNDIATVVENGCKIHVDDIVEVEENGTVTLQDVEIRAVGAEFTTSETFTLTLSSGFGFHAKGTEDSGYADIVMINGGEKLELTFKKATDRCNISNMEIDALTAPVGAVASLTITGSTRGEATTDVAVVTEEANVRFEVGSNNVVVNGKTVTNAQPTPAIWEDNDGTVMIAFNAASRILGNLDGNTTAGWSRITNKVTFSAGNKTVELTVGSKIAVVNGKNEELETECIIRNYADGDYACFPMADFFQLFGAKNWEVNNGEGGFYLELDSSAPQQNGCDIGVNKVVQVEEGSTVTLEDVNLEADGADFAVGETLTLTITPGFAFVDYTKTDSAEADIVSIAPDKIVLKPNQTASDITIKNIRLEAVKAVAGNTAYLTVSGDQRTGDSTKVARVIEVPAFVLDIKDDVELHVGRGADLETLYITKTKGAFKEGEEITFSLNNGKYFSFNQIEVENEKLNITPGDTTATFTVPQKLDGEDKLEVTEWTVEVNDRARVNTEAVVSVTIGNYTEEITVGTVVDYSMTGKFSHATVTANNPVEVQKYGVLTQTPAPGILIEIDEVDYRYVESGTTPKAVLVIRLSNATLDNFDLNGDEIVDANERANLQKLINISNLNVTAVLESVDDWRTLEFWIYGRLAKGDKITVDLPANFYKGTEAKVYVKGDIIDNSNVAADKLPQFAVLRKDVMTVTAQPKDIAKYGRVYLYDIVVNCGNEEFSEGKMICLDFDKVKGFTFDESRFGKIKATNAEVSKNKSDADEIHLTVNADVNEIVLNDVAILSDGTVALGDQAILNVSYAGFKDKATVVAVVVQDSLVLDVNPQTVRSGGTATYNVFGIDKTRGGRFKWNDEVTLTLSAGFAFVNGPIYDNDGTQIIVKEWSDNKVVVYAPENPEHGFDMEGMTICATTAKAGDVATVTATVAGYDPVSRDVLTVERYSSGGGGGSKKTPAPAAPAAPAPVSTEQTTTENGQTSTVDTTADAVQPVSQAEKESYQAQLKNEMPAADVVGDGAYTFAMTASAPSDNGASGNTSGGTKDPEKVSFDLSGQNVTDTAHLTLVKYVTQPDGTVEVVKLGGAFDPATNTFSAYADGEGVYDLIQDPDVTKITFAIGQTNISVNDAVQTNDVPPVLHDSKTMVPLRAIAEAMGVNVTWNEATKTVHMSQGDKKISLPVDGGDDTAMIMNDRTMVHLRYIGESFGANVRWIPSTQTIEIVK